jgi:hypothetical protein
VPPTATRRAVGDGPATQLLELRMRRGGGRVLLVLLLLLRTPERCYLRVLTRSTRSTIVFLCWKRVVGASQRPQKHACSCCSCCACAADCAAAAFSCCVCACTRSVVSLRRAHSRLYGESLYGQKTAVQKDGRPWPRRAADSAAAAAASTAFCWSCCRREVPQSLIQPFV